MATDTITIDTTALEAARRLAVAHREVVITSQADTAWIGSTRTIAFCELREARRALRVACGGPAAVYSQADIGPGVTARVNAALEAAGLLNADGALAPWACAEGPGFSEALRVNLA